MKELRSPSLHSFIKGFLGSYFPGVSGGKEATCNVGGPGSIPGLGRCPGEGNSNPLQCSCLENPMDREACWATVQWGHKELDMTECDILINLGHVILL